MGLNKTIHILPLPQNNRLKPIAGLNIPAVGLQECKVEINADYPDSRYY